MDSSCKLKDKLACLQTKELKHVLTQLGASSEGTPQVLLDRIFFLLSDEQVSKVHGPKKNSIGKEAIIKIIDDTYRNIQIPGPTDLASKGQTDSYIRNIELDEVKVRCLCNSSFPSDSMIQCEDPQCRVWQHIECVIIPEKPTKDAPAVPSQFYCEICRIKRADPFWVTVEHPLFPRKLTFRSARNTTKSRFPLTSANMALLRKKGEYEVQAWCMLLNDTVSFRIHWPLCSDLVVNDTAVHTVVDRDVKQFLGANGRDDGTTITTNLSEGDNSISLSGFDKRTFCLGVRIARRLTIDQVLNMIPKESEGELFDDALARVFRCIGGGSAAENADSDSDLEVLVDLVTVSLLCPISGCLLKIAGRFKPCTHVGSFDLRSFVELTKHSRKWQCPICLKNYSFEHLIIDPYLNRIVTKTRDCGDINEIYVKSDGSWRVKKEHQPVLKNPTIIQEIISDSEENNVQEILSENNVQESNVQESNAQEILSDSVENNVLPPPFLTDREEIAFTTRSHELMQHHQAGQSSRLESIGTNYGQSGLEFIGTNYGTDSD